MSKQAIYNTLRSSGLSRAGALAMMGNWQCESGLEAGRLQGDFSPYRTVSKDYVRRVEDFSLTRDQFARDATGFGLAQWTYYSRKYALWDAWHKSGLSIASEELQVKFAVSELKGSYAGLYSYLCTTNDLYEATARICREFERPAVNNIDARFSAAKTLQYELDLDGSAADLEPDHDDQHEDPHALILPDCRMGSTGAAVTLLQAALNVRGYNCGIADGIFGARTQAAVNAFKGASDGLCDSETWNRLLERSGKNE